MDFKKIFNAWITAYNPTEKELELAEKRNLICNDCPSKKVVTEKLKIGTICGECGCPISKKIFSDQFNDCPLKKWEEVDSQYFSPRKKNVTLF